MKIYLSIMSVPIVFFGIRLMLTCNRLCLGDNVNGGKKLILTISSLLISGPVLSAILVTAFMGIIPLVENFRAISQHWPYSIVGVINTAILSINLCRNRELLFYGRR